MTTNSFAIYIGLARSENLYQIKRGNNGISKALAEKIVTKFPEIDRLWLLTGEGQMFADARLRGPQIPLYRLDVEEQIRRTSERRPDEELLIPALEGCDLAMIYYGEAMRPTIPAGAIVVLKKADPEAVIPGREYVVICQKMVTLRTLRTSDQEGVWRLVAADAERFDELRIARTEIEALYRVEGKLIINK